MKYSIFQATPKRAYYQNIIVMLLDAIAQRLHIKNTQVVSHSLSSRFTPSRMITDPHSIAKKIDLINMYSLIE